MRRSRQRKGIRRAAPRRVTARWDNRIGQGKTSGGEPEVFCSGVQGLVSKGFKEIVNRFTFVT